MTHEEYERRKQRLARELQAGMEMLEAAHRYQLKALELVWSATGGDGAAIRTSVMTPAAPSEPVAPPAEPPRPGRRKAGELREAIWTALAQVPEVFDRNDICEALGYDPDRGSLYRVLRDLQDEGALVIERDGSGNAPTIYKKTGT